MKLTGGVTFILTLFSCAAQFCSAASGKELVWGTSAVTLAPACAETISLTSLLSDPKSSISLGPFYRAGGENRPVTPTECRIAHNARELLVVFRCAEKDLAYPALDHAVDWYSHVHSPIEQDAAFPDKVDLFVSPDMSKAVYYQFAVTLDGQKFGVKRNAHLHKAQTDEEPVAPGKVEKVRDFSAVVSKGQKEWTVVLRIPWQTVGGRPDGCFGLIPVRTRWRQGEITSPVAVDFADRPPTDLFIETAFPGAPTMMSASGCLCRLPSGAWRWQRPALLTYPDAATVREIWQMEQTLSQPTRSTNLAQRVYLAQRWTDLLELEGFCFRPSSGSITDENLSPSLVRGGVNTALRAKDPGLADRLLDDYLNKLDAVSRQWFADGSPGNIRTEQWETLTAVNAVEEQDGIATFHCLAEKRPMDLHFSFPNAGGVRLWANGEGYFKPASLRPMTLSNGADKVSVTASNASVVLSRRSLEMSFCNPAGHTVVRLDGRSIAFRFDATGKVLAVDFSHRLDRSEVIYGFGERFDRFNENGNVLTLWGVDAWNGNTAGLRNQSYKPVPVFHSSKGYSIFVNSSYRLRADIGQANPSEYRLSQQGPIFDYYFWMEPAEQAIQSYTELTGQPILPPKWAFEPWMGRTGRGWNGGPLHNAVAEEEEVARRFGQENIPHSAIYSEGVGADSAALHQFMAKRGLKVLSWFFPVIGAKTQAQLLPALKKTDLPILNAGKNASIDPIDYVDFTHPNALELSRRWWKRRLDLGLAGSMVDFGDRTPESAVFYDGRKGDEMHNFYSYDYQRTYHDVFAEKRGEDFILFGRAAAPGTQKWAGQFPGDQPANFGGLQAVLTGGLNLCACGFSTWGSDLGGFVGWPGPAVYMRWTQFACFSPLMRSHGRTPREPWEYGEAAVRNYKRYAWVRENLLDYIYDAAVQAHQTGLPMMRSLAVAYPQEPALADVPDEYMFGNDLLVAPVITEDNERTISFPSGRWTSLWDGSVVAGPACAHLKVPLDTIPVFLKEGSAVPMRLSRNLHFGESMAKGAVDALIIAPPQGSDEPSFDAGSGVMFRSVAKGFSITCRSVPEAQYLVFYGGGISRIQVDGTILHGWHNDSRSGRVEVLLPKAVKEGGPLREISVQLETRHARR